MDGTGDLVLLSIVFRVEVHKTSEHVDIIDASASQQSRDDDSVSLFFSRVRVCLGDALDGFQSGDVLESPGVSADSDHLRTHHRKQPPSFCLFDLEGVWAFYEACLKLAAHVL